MPRLRPCLLLAALLFSGCDHHKPADQAQTEAGSAAVAENESSLTGLPPQPDNLASEPKYPRATLATLPDDSPAPALNPPSDESVAAATQDKPAEATSSPSDASSKSPPQHHSSSTPVAAAPMENLPESAPAPEPAPEPAPAVEVTTTPAPSMDNARAEKEVVVVETSFGSMVIELDETAAPQTCANFRKLVSSGFYNHTTFHRVLPRFIIQGGDPNSKSDNRDTYGQGSPGYTVPAEIKLSHDRGAVAMARSPDSVNPQRDSNGSQFYICLAACPSLDDKYTVFGHVIKGLDVAEKIAQQPRDVRDNPNDRIEMEVSLESKYKAMGDSSASNP